LILKTNMNHGGHGGHGEEKNGERDWRVADETGVVGTADARKPGEQQMANILEFHIRIRLSSVTSVSSVVQFAVAKHGIRAGV
jgi:hypothetical protein